MSQNIAGLTIISSCGAGRKAASDNNVMSSFGLLTDCHFARRKQTGTRYYEQSINKLSDAISVFNKLKPDFVIELGDFKDMGANKSETISFLDEIEAEYQKFNGPVYHVLGNHDVDNISKDDFLKHIDNHGQKTAKPYYSFVNKNIKYIVLDANCNEDGTDFDSGNYDWTKAFIAKPQLEWLTAELKTHLPVIVFLHELLDLTQKHHGVCVGNATEVIDILEYNGNVLAVFQGHHHAGSYYFGNGIHYYTVKGMIEGAMPENNGFALVEIDKALNISIDGYFNEGDMMLKKSGNL
ncbi:MAG: metallophosphoesterase [Tannerella sp.]|jgi:alkaline phosphatase|nr:metallophosphoesterase [Tannerella sp.]